MKNRLHTHWVVFLLVLLASCSASNRLPPLEKVATHPYGSEISVERKHNNSISGELIVADWRGMIVYDYKSDSCIEIPRSEAGEYFLTFAKPRNYGALIPISILSTAIHGYYAAFTLPLNMITTIAVTAGAYTSVRYTQKQMPYNSLHMFARFPQGLPPGIQLRDIHREP
ncbi:MAG: hypothetical protein LW707_01755 [Sphingobacteriales bacterium]|nr:hypothetical protein [Sphingobacteriales bacterium]